MNIEDIKDSNYIQMQITSIENEFSIRHAPGSFIDFFSHLILKLTSKVGISYVY